MGPSRSSGVRRGAERLRGLLGRRAALLVLAAESIDPALRVDELLLAGIEGVAVRANVDGEIPARRASHERVAAGAHDLRPRVLRVNAFLHDRRPSFTSGTRDLASFCDLRKETSAAK